MQVSNLKIGFNNNEILKNISFHLVQGEKVGLVGPNGSGKSTLLKVLANELQLDSGKVKLENETIAYLKQEISHEFDDYSIIDYIKNQTGIGKLEIRLHELEDNLNENNMIEYSDVLDNFLSLDGYSFENNLQNSTKSPKVPKSQDDSSFSIIYYISMYYHYIYKI